MSKQLDDKARVIRDETTDAANTAERVGAFLLDFLQQALLPYDPAKSYAAGQNVVWRGQIVRALQAVPAGKTPDDAAYWGNDAAQAAEISATAPNRAVGSRAIAEFVAQQLNDLAPTAVTVPVADETTAGRVRRANAARLENPAEPGHATDYVTPEQVLALIGPIADGTTLDAAAKRGAETDEVLHVGGVSGDWAEVADAALQVVVQIIAGRQRLAVMPIGAATGGAGKPELVVRNLPALSGVVGVTRTVTLPADLLTAGDNPVIVISQDGDLPSGYSYESGPRRLTITARSEGTVSIKLIGATPDGRTKRLSILDTVAAAGVTLSIDYLGLGTNGDALSAYVRANVGAGFIRLTLNGENGTTYAAVSRNGVAGTYTRPSLFAGTTNFIATWGNVGGMDNRPPMPGNYHVRAELLTANGQPYTPPLSYDANFTISSTAIEQELYPNGPVNKPPVYKNNLPAALTVPASGEYADSIKNYFSDPENDTLTYYMVNDVNAPGNSVTVDSTTGAFTIRSNYRANLNDGKFYLYALDAQNRRAESGVCQVIIGQAATLQIDRVDIHGDIYVFPGESVSSVVTQYRLKLTNVPAGAALQLEIKHVNDTGAVLLTQTVDVTAQAAEWYTHTAQRKRGTEPSTATKFEHTLLVGSARYTLVTLTKAQLDAVFAYGRWDTVLGAGVTNVTLQAEDAVTPNQGKATILDTNTNQMVTYLGDFGETGSRVDFALNLAAAGSYPVTVAYSSAGDSACNIVVGGVTQLVPLPSTAYYDKFKTTTVSLNLPAGQNTLSVQGIAGKYFRLDKITVPNAALGGSTPPPTPGNPSAFTDYDVRTFRRMGPCHFLYGYRTGPNRLPDTVREMLALFADALTPEYTIGLPVFVWEQFEPAPGQYDWTLIDLYFTACRELGIPVGARLQWARTLGSANLQQFIPDSERMRDQAGVVQTFSSLAYPSFESEYVTARIETTITAFLDHLVTAGFADLLVFQTNTVSHFYEGEFNLNTSGNPETYGLGGYEGSSQAKFRQRAQQWYGSIQALNAAYGTSYNVNGDWSQINMPVIGGPYNGPNWAFNSPQGRDVYRHRLLSLSAWHNRLNARIKAHSPFIKTGLENGNQQDPLSAARNTLGLSAFVNADFYKQNADEAYNIFYQREVGCLGGKGATGDELFFHSKYNAQANTYQYSDYDMGVILSNMILAGNTIISCAGLVRPGTESTGSPNWQPSLSRNRAILTTGVGRAPMNSPVNYTYAETHTQSLRAMVNQGGPWNTGDKDAWIAKTQNYTRKVAVAINDDLTNSGN